MKSIAEQIKERIGYCPSSSKVCGNCGHGMFTVSNEGEISISGSCHIFTPDPFKVESRGTCDFHKFRTMGQKL